MAAAAQLQNIFQSFWCTQEAAGHLFCYCISDEYWLHGHLQNSCHRGFASTAGIMWDCQNVCYKRIKWQMLAKSWKWLLNSCSLALAMTTYLIPQLKSFWVKLFWILLPSIKERVKQFKNWTNKTWFESAQSRTMFKFWTSLISTAKNWRWALHQ